MTKPMRATVIAQKIMKKVWTSNLREKKKREKINQLAKRSQLRKQ